MVRIIYGGEVLLHYGNGQFTLVQSLCKPFTVKGHKARFLAVNIKHKIPENPHHRLETHSSGHPNDSIHDRDALNYGT